jgi:low temperature requirement protein LtrA
VERHGLIVLIAIGESLVAIGLGARHTALGALVLVTAVLGLVVATSFWLAYFDFFPARAQHLLTDRAGAEQVTLARDVYTYFHLPLVTGIVLFAFGVKETLTQVGDRLGTVAAVALCGGPALYVATFVAIRVRVSRTVGRGRPLAALACATIVPVALVVPAVVALALVAAVWIALHVYELVWFRAERAEARGVPVQAG